MNLRDIKKDIEFLIGDFVEDCLLFAMLHPEKELGQVETLINEASDMADDLFDKVNHPAADVKARAYYNRVGAELLTGLDKLYERLSALAK
ncbi:MAG: hypothetical protein IKQ01_04545 [Bacteroidales bacterium]|jgi:hypothetical protein|nr:hypothetical protein [Bacteroidales bacterium]MBR4352318.1 hypothetical protein [Bacteroidales bacterium]